MTLPGIPISSRIAVLLAGLVVGCMVSAGCGDDPHADKPTGGSTITITYGGAPVTEGQVDLRNEQTGEGGGAPLNEKGVAVLQSVPQGTYTVTVFPPSPDPTPVLPGETPPPNAEKQYPNIPEKFRRAATSPLRAEVKEGTADYAFDLKE